ncbi:hypothetical protein IF2G_04246 [Cordyceps javanica]|nr:hypothetical protein IF2G_04246 [Cordyceps javanica]
MTTPPQRRALLWAWWLTVVVGQECLVRGHQKSTKKAPRPSSGPPRLGAASTLHDFPSTGIYRYPLPTSIPVHYPHPFMPTYRYTARRHSASQPAQSSRRLPALVGVVRW